VPSPPATIRVSIAAARPKPTAASVAPEELSMAPGVALISRSS